MFSTKNPEQNFIKQWKHFHDSLTTHFEVSTKIIIEHGGIIDQNSNPGKNQNAILHSENTLKTLLQIPKSIEIYKKKIERYLKTLDPIPNNFHNIYREIISDYCKLLSFIVQISKILSDKYLYKKFILKNLDKKKECVKKAYDTMQFAWGLLEQHPELLPINYDPDLSGFMRHVKAELLEYFPENITNEIQKIMSQAAQTNDTEQATEKYQEAFEMAKKEENYELLFLITCKQAANYFQKSPAIRTHAITRMEIEDQHKVVRKCFDFFVVAKEIKLSHLATSSSETILQVSESICNDLYFISHFFYRDSNHSCFKRDLDKRLSLLEEAERYHTIADEIAFNIKKSFNNYPSLSKRIALKIKMLEFCKKEIQHQEKIKHEQEQYIAVCLKKYDEKFHEILSQFSEDTLEKSQRKTKNKYKNPPNQQQKADDCTTLSSDSDSEEALAVENMSDENTSAQNPFLNLQNNIRLLNKAQQEGDAIQQVYLNSHIADCYYLDALHLLKRHHIPKVITKLTNAKNHLSFAVTIISELSNQFEKTSPLDEAKEWILIQMNKIKALLEKIILSQKTLKDKLDHTRLSIMNHIITTYGKHAWYKNKPSISEAAKTRQMINAILIRSNSIKKDIMQMHHNLIGGTQQINSPINSSTTQPLNQSKNNHANQFLFKNDQKLIKRQRSLSTASYFDPEAVSLRDNKRSLYGRK
ncbi:MAG: hypothetical protein KIT56_07740 [Gammaproteobacteria bacterium]|nr:hypothetical protein [Gammaproteobacteria bacterium]MCW5583752.1 hypothetical protein [Gammaproteobacteria bacterium]